MIIEVEKYNEVYVRVYAEAAIALEIAEYFTYVVENRRFMPAYKSGRWDGKIRLYNIHTNRLYYGLLGMLQLFAESHDYTIQYKDNLPELNNYETDIIEKFVEDLDVYSKGNKITVRDYQIDSLIHSLNNNRGVIESPTGSGKSLYIYTLIRWYIENNIKCIIIVPNTQLVEQLYNDFKDYSSNNGWNVDDNIQRIYYGYEKSNESNCIISTFQSAVKLEKGWFKEFGTVLVDECHLAESKSITSILENLTNAKHRFGTTGTLKEAKTHLLTLQGLFGPIHKVTSTKKLMDSNTLATLNIKAMLLEYPLEDCKAIKSYNYQNELKWLISNTSRNLFITNLSLYTKGNTLVLFQFVESHGKKLYELIKSKSKDRIVYFIHGGIDVKKREEMIQTLTTNKNVIIVASYQTLSTGINAPSIENIILASPSKSKIRILQSIGRSLRLAENKSGATIYDIGDNLKVGKKHFNFSLKHFIERIRLYSSEEFNYKLITTKLPN